MYVGDIPAAMVVEVPQDLGNYTGVTAKLRTPTGTESTLTASLDVDLNAIIVNWPTTSPFTVAGRFDVILALTGPGIRSRLAPIALIAQPTVSDGWHTLDSAREIWPDAEHLSDVQLSQLLEIAKTDCIAYAPELIEGDVVPESYRRAQLMQAANIMNASAVDPGTGEDGGTSYALKPFPLDWAVKQLLRPRRGKPIAL